MQELYSIMRELLEVEYNQESLRYIIKMLEAAYGQEDQGKENLIVSGVGYYLAVLHRDLGTAINRLDSYIAETAKKES
ncbi:MAG: hypothetical protein HFI56_01485 [Lachnospiraceae bacterium]|nr:hypothetical protein [Lachnospiraceae bacterium]